jgi:hypothetical protein
MKQNLIIILLTATVVLSLVNLLEGRYPPPAHAAFGGSSWAVGCPQQEDVCFFTSERGEVFRVSRGGVLLVGQAVK